MGSAKIYKHENTVFRCTLAKASAVHVLVICRLATKPSQNVWHKKGRSTSENALCMVLLHAFMLLRFGYSHYVVVRWQPLFSRAFTPLHPEPLFLVTFSSFSTVLFSRFYWITHLSSLLIKKHLFHLNKRQSRCGPCLNSSAKHPACRALGLDTFLKKLDPKVTMLSY